MYDPEWNFHKLYKEHLKLKQQLAEKEQEIKRLNKICLHQADIGILIDENKIWEKMYDQLEQENQQLKSLAIFMCETWTDIEKCKGNALQSEDIRDHLIMQWPVIQGTKQQFALRKVGQLTYDKKLITKGVELLLDINIAEQEADK